MASREFTVVSHIVRSARESTSPAAAASSSPIACSVRISDTRLRRSAPRSSRSVSELTSPRCAERRAASMFSTSARRSAIAAPRKSESRSCNGAEAEAAARAVARSCTICAPACMARTGGRVDPAGRRPQHTSHRAPQQPHQRAHKKYVCSTQSTSAMVPGAAPGQPQRPTAGSGSEPRRPPRSPPEGRSPPARALHHPLTQLPPQCPAPGCARPMRRRPTPAAEPSGIAPQPHSGVRRPACRRHRHPHAHHAWGRPLQHWQRSTAASRCRVPLVRRCRPHETRAPR